eukprot:m.23304 g.23304  ORF g.23304 m.23304 type:complete len:95 (+) comp7128_c0_seq1:1769-2053(+)
MGDGSHLATARSDSPLSPPSPKLTEIRCADPGFRGASVAGDRCRPKGVVLWVVFELVASTIVVVVVVAPVLVALVTPGNNPFLTTDDAIITISA